MQTLIQVEPGARHGRLTVVSEVEPQFRKNGAKYRVVNCRCDCGVEKVIQLTCLRTGQTQSCGCLMRDRVSAANRTHGHTVKGKTPTYRSWRLMIRRCEDPRSIVYHRYGAAGVKVCVEWHDFENFIKDVGERPDGMTLDRIDGTKGYEPGNVKWSTPKQQARNQKTNRIIEYKGEKKCLAAWAEHFGMGLQTLWSRLEESKWPLEKAFTTPVKGRCANLS